MDDAIPTLVNQTKVEVAPLSHGDVIQIGKHTLTYAVDVMELGVDLSTILPAEQTPQAQLSTGETHPSGMLQIMNGDNFGRIIPLNRNLTRIGHAGGDCAMISKRDEGYVLSFLEGPNPPVVNRISIGNGSHRLREGDILEIGGTKMQFHN